MGEKFQARVSTSIEDIVDVLTPKRVGVGVLHYKTADWPAVIAVHLTGKIDNKGPDVSLIVALDAERAAGLIVQLQEMLLDAGVPGDTIRTMMREAESKLEEVLAPSRTEPPSFTCPLCKMTSYHPDDVANSYCGNCHAFIKRGQA